MINLYYKNRLLIQLLSIIFIIFFIFNSVNSFAQLIKPGEVNNSIEISDIEIIEVNIPQGSSASQISSILDSTGIVTSSLAFELSS